MIKPILAELKAAREKFPDWPSDPLHALAILGEEYGELTKAMLQMCYQPNKACYGNVLAEAIQTAAMALRFVMSLDRYEYKRGDQHSQDAAPQEAQPPVQREPLTDDLQEQIALDAVSATLNAPPKPMSFINRQRGMLHGVK